MNSEAGTPPNDAELRAARRGTPSIALQPATGEPESAPQSAASLREQREYLIKRQRIALEILTAMIGADNYIPPAEDSAYHRTRITSAYTQAEEFIRQGLL